MYFCPNFITLENNWAQSFGQKLPGNSFFYFMQRLLVKFEWIERHQLMVI